MSDGIDWKLIRSLAGGPHVVIPNTIQALVHAGPGAVLMAHCPDHHGHPDGTPHHHVIGQTAGLLWISCGEDAAATTEQAVRAASRAGITEWMVLHLEPDDKEDDNE